MTRATTDIDALMDQFETADYLRRHGWGVQPPEQVIAQQPLCRNLRCLTRIPKTRTWCHFCRRSRRLARRAA